jgi:ABC-type sugar transport system permease subunit
VHLQEQRGQQGLERHHQGRQGIPGELYEAADVDGATWWQKERRITIPMLRRNIALSLIISAPRPR